MKKKNPPLAKKNTRLSLNGVPETLFIPLYVRAKEVERPDALINDPKAVSVINEAPYDFSRFASLIKDEHDKIAIILRNREMDNFARNFLSQYPKGIIVHIGCGLDARFSRVDNGKVTWFDLDMPNVIKLRQKLVKENSPRHHLLSGSVLSTDWFIKINRAPSQAILFLAEGVFMYFTKDEVKKLVLTLQKHFPDSELVFDAMSALVVWANNRRIAKTQLGARYHWAIKNGKELETWGQNIKLLNQWFMLDRPHPRINNIRWLRFFPILAHAIGIYHYKLT